MHFLCSFCLFLILSYCLAPRRSQAGKWRVQNDDTYTLCVLFLSFSNSFAHLFFFLLNLPQLETIPRSRSPSFHREIIVSLSIDFSIPLFPGSAFEYPPAFSPFPPHLCHCGEVVEIVQLGPVLGIKPGNKQVHLVCALCAPQYKDRRGVCVSRKLSFADADNGCTRLTVMSVTFSSVFRYSTGS